MKVYVGDMGIIVSNGKNIAEFSDSIFAGKSGITVLSNLDYSKIPVKIGGEIKNEGLLNSINLNEERSSLLLDIAAAEALKDINEKIHQLEPDRIGVFIGTSYSGIGCIEENCKYFYNNQENKIAPMTVIKSMRYFGASNLARKYKIEGLSLTYDTACSASLHALGNAYLMIKNGLLDVAIVGGADIPLSPLSLLVWSRLRILANNEINPEEASSPFDKNSKGIVLGEGAGVIILFSEKAMKKAKFTPLAEIAGYGFSNDPTHITKSNADYMAKSIARAFSEHHELMGSINYIQAHGTGTQVNDIEESKAIKMIFGKAAENIKVNSIKSMTGHLIGGSGIISAITTVIQMNGKKVHPTLNLKEPYSGCDLNYVKQISEDWNIQAALVNAFAFGGSFSSILLHKTD
jgi:3-oxoacyl-[acyl-carrier-protein] synthase II